jgi:hypothetical protein
MLRKTEYSDRVRGRSGGLRQCKEASLGVDNCERQCAGCVERHAGGGIRRKGRKREEGDQQCDQVVTRKSEQSFCRRLVASFGGLLHNGLPRNQRSPSPSFLSL